MAITDETKRESHQRTVKGKRQLEILNALGDKEMTAREIMTDLGYKDLNAVRPRITELTKAGIIDVTGKTYDTLTKRKVAIFKKREGG